MPSKPLGPCGAKILILQDCENSAVLRCHRQAGHEGLHKIKNHLDYYVGDPSRSASSFIEITFDKPTPEDVINA